MPDIKEVKSQQSSDKKPASKAAIAYPYYNLEASIEAARVIHERGGNECTPEQLASFLGYSTTNSGSYLTRVSSAKLFGLIEGSKASLRSTDRALAIISPVMEEDGIKAKVDAFMEVPLYKEVFDRFKGKNLPPEVGLKNLFSTAFKIGNDRLNPALRVFYESATSAGLFDLSPDRTQLIMPIMKKGSSPLSEAQKPKDEERPLPERPRGGGDGGPGGIHPALTGLLRELPQPGPWNADEKKRFMEAFTGIFDFIYPSEPKG